MGFLLILHIVSYFQIIIFMSFLPLRQAWSSLKLEKSNKLRNKGMRPSAASCSFLRRDKSCVKNGQQGEKHSYKFHWVGKSDFKKKNSKFSLLKY